MSDSYFQRSSLFLDGRIWVWLVGTLLFVTLGMKAGDIIAGRLPGNDDLLRLQQVRDLLGGQAWFDVDQVRFLTPEGGEMHWSRIPDLFLAGVILLTKPFIGQANAELLAVILWPLFLLLTVLCALVAIMRRLDFTPVAQALGLAFFGVSGAIYNFWPGRIDHHNLVVALTLIGVAAALSRQLTIRSGLLAGLCTAIMMSIALESLPYAGMLILCFGLFWIVRGHLEAPRLLAFGATLAIGAVLLYALDAPGWSDARAVCDAYGQSHMAGFVVGGFLLAMLGIFGGKFETWQSRLIAGGIAGIATLSVVVLVQPSCLGDPYADVSDQARLAWLSAVGEARTMSRIFIDDPEKAVWQYGYILAGLLAALVMIQRAPAGQRLPRIGLSLFMLFAGLATVWQIRGVTFSHVFASLTCAWVVGEAILYWWRKRGAGPALALCFGAALFSPIGWKLIAGPFDRPAPSGSSDKAYNILCIDPDAYAALPEEAQMRVFTPIDLGMSVLMRTPHEVFAGPYHRNVQGIERVTDVFMGPKEEARDKLLAMNATHFLYCQGLPETARYGRLRPEGFAAQLETGDVPSWLQPIDDETETDGVVRLYRIERASSR